KRFPENFDEYAIACKQKEVIPGKMFVHSTGSMINPRFIINFPTKRHWRGTSRIEDIESGLSDLKQVIINNAIKSIAIPPLGCGLGGLDWKIVRPIIENVLQDLTDVKILLFEPGNAPTANQMVHNSKRPMMTIGRAALLELIQQYLLGLLDPYITLLEVHKLMYFLQESGEPLCLNYKKSFYGPYANNLRHVLNLVEGHFISGYADGGDDPTKNLTIIPDAAEEAKRYLKKYPETSAKIQKVGVLVEGFESAFGLELLATVHWLIVKENIRALNDIITAVHNWNKHKLIFNARQIEIAARRLQEKGWINGLTGLS
ncbi:MAG: macro domain-containing protein, partial [Lentisphaeria bacterium]|nr:macro domain-containing protein [Lentisphaeria bacterium]